MDFGQILKELLSDRGLTQADLCRITGIQTSLMSEYANGRKSPALSNAFLISRALNVTLDILVGKTVVGKQETEKLINIIESLNEDGKKKVIDYATDLKASGLYKKS